MYLVKKFYFACASKQGICDQSWSHAVCVCVRVCVCVHVRVCCLGHARRSKIEHRQFGVGATDEGSRKRESRQLQHYVQLYYMMYFIINISCHVHQ